MQGYQIVYTPKFEQWLRGLRDHKTRARLLKRLLRVQHGNLGDIKPVGCGVYEMREHFGPGWRMYYTQKGQTLILMLGGGDKTTQARDIAKAIELAQQLEE